ncbi:FecR domain-containing protein [Candidatus Falkowbacteria bacterium]|jgi:hypothetical protein|nr:FecR domain-containing protein [Candidatus Falkowbacteria bacterium]MBT5503234.1 FecR domain-containing protein [Candidatus Falkowbacteria bacterium]MBT7348532.1 FecR domain-containing protein [Candidatus Falkowbacteria bacterium]MBT7500802.1 FecR domain-containing protein [Candidatus Falkowbacteria bacterium]
MKVYSGSKYPKHKSYYKKPFLKTRGFYFLLIVIIAVSSFIYFSIKNTSPEDINDQKFSDQNNLPINSAKVLLADGSLEIKAPNENWQAIGPDFQIESQSYIKTGSDSKAIIELPDKSLIRMKADTQIKLEEIGMADIIIEQLNGTAFHRVNDSSTAIYRVKNGSSELTALGTAFNVFTTSQLTKVTVTESRVKAKIYDKDENIINMRTIDSGTTATINPDLALEKMIETEDVSSNDLIDDNWYAWNLEQDQNYKFFTGIFEQTIKLVITKPEKAEMTVDNEKITIAGETEPGADIFMSGKELDNNDGHFETEYLLGSGENEIEIVVQKGKNKNKRLLLITSTKEKSILTLSGKTEDNAVTLSWESENLDDFTDFIVLKGGTEDPTYPDAPYHSVKSTLFSDTWSNLSDGHYFFRICTLNSENECSNYTDNYETSVGENNVTEGSIALVATKEDENITLSWNLSNDLNPTDGFKTIISQTEDPVYPGNSYHSLNSNERNDTWKKLTPATYYFRVCLLKDNVCILYSNNVAIELEELQQTGKLTLIGAQNGNKIDLAWENSDTPVTKGFKVIMGESPGITFPSKDHHLITSNTATNDSWANLETGKTYYFRICQNLGSSCGVYSNEVKINF